MCSGRAWSRRRHISSSGSWRAAPFRRRWCTAVDGRGCGPRTSPARYLDALLADGDGRPWAVELKDQEAGGGHGAYLRHGIGQAVLYRHYIKSVAELDPWFAHHGLDRTKCQAAVAFPNAAPATANVIKRLRALAKRYDVDVVEFARPT